MGMPRPPGSHEPAGGLGGGSGGPQSGLFSFLARGDVPAQVSDAAWLQAMLDVEAALAGAEAQAGVIPATAAEAIAACCDAAAFDADEIGREASADPSGTPVPALVSALTARVAASSESAAGYVHWGATSQDVMDTALMLIIRRSVVPLARDIASAAQTAASLAGAHRSDPMLGRTLLQPAAPTTFGAVTAGWLAGLDRAARRLDEALEAGLAVQLGGAVGTLASLGDRGEAVLSNLAAALDLPEPDLPWHTERSRVVELAAALGEAAGAAGKVGLDVVLLTQAEIGEVIEAGSGGGSSTIPQKRNPIAAVMARSCAARTPGLVATLMASMPQELQRGAGTWQLEWPVMSELLLATGSGVAWIRESLEHLRPDTSRMAANLGAAGGLPTAEHVTAVLTPSLGRLEAHRIVAQAAREATETGRPFAETLGKRHEISVHLNRRRIDDLLDPAGYLGSATAFVDRALAAHERIGARR
jgi:3-carboxy-cis,cis-muconate cycloisomerase